MIAPPPRLLETFQSAYHAPPAFVVRAPGRVDVIGSHTDYNEGWVLAAAIDRQAWLAVAPSPDATVAIHAFDLDQKVAFPLVDLESRRDSSGGALPGWALYAAGVAWSLQQEDLSTPGCRIALTSDVPQGAGLSSSAAVEVGYALVWAHLGGWQVDRMKLAQLCQRAENQYVGVNSGLMDQFASLHGRAGHGLFFDCRTLDWEALPLPDDCALIVADTGTRRTLAASHYNRRREECEEAVFTLQDTLPNIRALRDVTIEQFEAFMDVIPQPARRRAAHIIGENDRVRAAADALRAGDGWALGRLMDESHASARDLFEASGPALDGMWEIAHRHPACRGGRAVGAGWAGCMVFLVSANAATDFTTHLVEGYHRHTGTAPVIYPVRPADGAQVVRESSG